MNYFDHIIKYRATVKLALPVELTTEASSLEEAMHNLYADNYYTRILEEPARCIISYDDIQAVNSDYDPLTDSYLIESNKSTNAKTPNIEKPNDKTYYFYATALVNAIITFAATEDITQAYKKLSDVFYTNVTLENIDYSKMSRLWYSRAVERR